MIRMIRTLPYLALAVLLGGCGIAPASDPHPALGRDDGPVRIGPPTALVTPESGGPARGDQDGSWLHTGNGWTRWEDL